MKRALSLLLACLLLALLLPVSAVAAPTKAQRDIQSALNQDGHIAQLGDLLYYYSGGYMNSMKPDGSAKKKLFKVSGGYNLMAYGGQIYYLADDAKGDRHLYSFAPGAKKGTLVQKEVNSAFIHKGTAYFVGQIPTTLYALNLKTGKKTAAYKSKYGMIEGASYIQDMLVIYDRAVVEGDDAIVLMNTASGKTKAYVGFLSSVNAWGDKLYFLDGSRNLIEYSFSSTAPSMKKGKTIRKNVLSYMISGDYFYITEADADFAYLTVYKRSVQTGKETVFIKKTKRGDYVSGPDATLEPMGGRIWRFTSDFDNVALETSLAK